MAGKENTNGRNLSLKTFIFLSTLLVSFATFCFIFLVTSSTYKKAYAKQTNDITRGISNQITNSLLQLMEKGWTRTELELFLEPMVAATPEIPLSVTIYRSPAVETLYGLAAPSPSSPYILAVLKNGVSKEFSNNHVIRRIVGIKAADSCLSCHDNVKRGDVLGALEIKQDLSKVFSVVYKNFYFLFFILSPLPFIMAFFIARYTTNKINHATSQLSDNIQNVNSIDDLSTIVLGSGKTDFSELNQILSEFNSFVEKMRNVAIDKSMLEFEVNLLETFIITSETVKDWKEHVSRLLNQVNGIMDAYLLFSIFQVGDKTYDLEVFWRSTPSKETKDQFDQLIQNRLAETSRFRPLSSIKINHTIVNYDQDEIVISADDINLQVKSIFLEKPQIGGVVGLGVHALLTQNEGRALVIKSILTTLINVIGSVKAIYKYTKELEHYATRDPLTNLYNQKMFWDLAANEIVRSERQKKPFSLVIIDMDNFKMINERYGYAYGDTYLQIFAGEVKKCLRDGDILSRYGSDELVVILPESDQEQAYAVSERILKAAKQFADKAPGGKKVMATVSIGISVYPNDSEDLHTLYILADNMMYKAKKDGKGRICVPTSEDIVEVIKATEEKALFLLDVLKNKDKVVPFFQPIMRIDSGFIGIYELLMGIEHEGRVLAAGEFIEMAERMGIVSQLDYIVIEKAFEKLQKANYQGLLFVNLSPKSLILGEFIRNIRELADKYQIKPAQIVFEITERETVRNRTLLDKFIKGLKTEGFKFAIDDFGAGFSTFQYIKMFPIDYIKIEGEFVKNSISGDIDRAFVKCIISLAKDLNIETIAEMIEDQDVMDTITELGADYAQGYHIREPRREL